MDTLFFFYTLAILVLCIVCAVLSSAAWVSSRRRIFIYSTVAFVCYMLELTEIFFNDYIMQNLTFPETEYYAIPNALIRSVLVTVLQGSIWLITLDIVDRKKTPRRVLAPLAVFFVSNVLAIYALPHSPVRQWIYYTTRQVFTLFCCFYVARCYRASDDESYRARLGKLRNAWIVIIVLSLCVVLEDIYVILIAPMNTQPEWLTLYLAERNFSENILVCFLAVLLIRYAYETLSIRIRQAPVQEDVDDLDRHIDEQMPFFCEAHKLSKREAEVLKLVLLGENNQEIANHLYLAVGTVKAHVHNIMKKCGKSSREELTLFFWQS